MSLTVGGRFIINSYHGQTRPDRCALRKNFRWAGELIPLHRDNLALEVADFGVQGMAKLPLDTHGDQETARFTAALRFTFSASFFTR
jgi:hypothetical protein